MFSIQLIVADLKVFFKFLKNFLIDYTHNSKSWNATLTMDAS